MKNRCISLRPLSSLSLFPRLIFFLPSTVHLWYSPTLVQFSLLLDLQIVQIKDSYAYKTGYYPSWIMLLLFTKISNFCLLFPSVTKKDWGGHIRSSERLFIKFPRDISIGGLITTSKMAFNSFIRAIRSITWHVVQIKPKAINASTTLFTTLGEIAPTNTSSNFVKKTLSRSNETGKTRNREPSCNNNNSTFLSHGR